MRIVSPSKNRIDYTIDKVLGDDIDIFVEPQDIEKYKDRTNKLFNIEENDKGFGYVMNYIIKHYHEKGERYILFADDDIFGLKRLDKEEFKIKDFCEEAIGIMKKNNYAQLMVSFSGHNWFQKQELKERAGCWGMIFMDTKQIIEAGNFDKALKLFADWDMTARLIKAGKNVAIWKKYMFLHKMKSKDGGAMDYYKNNAFMRTMCIYLKRKWGDNVRVIYHEKHEQFEIRFKWRNL